MQKRRTSLLYALCILLLLCALPATALANAAEPPGLTVLVRGADAALSLRLRFPSGEAVELQPERRLGESQYRFFYHSLPGSRDAARRGAQLIVQSAQGERSFFVPGECFGYNAQVTLDLEAGTLTAGQNPLREPLLIALRVLLTLLIEGLVLFLFGYRERHSWILFLLVNLLTQGLLNVLFAGARGYWQIFYVAAEALIFAAEAIAFSALLKERGKKRALLCALAANAASLALGALLLTYLPV